MSMATAEEKVAAIAVHSAAAELTKVITAASALGLDVVVEILPHYTAKSGVRISTPIITAGVRKVEVL